ncbi:MAG: methyl-accepting chemotaxis protein [Brachymonas sp.]|nr:methyl-accepting chemotaxis protein [Brachymonas sp.]
MNAASIRRAITVLLVLIVVSLGALGFAFYALQRASTNLENAEESRVRAYQLIAETQQSADDLTRLARNFVATLHPDYLRQYYAVLDIRNGRIARPERYHDLYWKLVDPNNPQKPRPDTNEIVSLTELLEQAGFTEQELDLVLESERQSNTLALIEVEAMNMAQGRYLDAQGTYARLDTPNRERASQMLYDDKYTQGIIAETKPLDEFAVLVEQRLVNTIAAANKAERYAQLLFFGLMVLSLVLIGLLIWFSGRLSRLELAEKAAQQKKAEDENERLNNSVISVLQAVHQLSERDLTVKAPVTEDVMGAVSDSINQLAGETARVLHGVTGIADQVAQVSTNVKQQADNVAQTAEKERQNVNQMMSSLQTAVQTMDRVAEMVEKSNQSAEQATQVTNNALNTVNDTVRGMESIRATIAETEKRIKRLGERSQEISGIVNLINTIAERTHVLALNASMQAAVAGEAGRGFSVVAEEVQRLAESSRNATQQIATLVGNIQQETNETINTVNRTIGQVVEGSEQAQAAGEQMRRTQEITTQLVSQVQGIAQASAQQKDMSQQLLQAVRQMGDSTQQTAQQIEAQNRETDTLQQAAARLVESVNVFKLPEQTA